MNGVQPWQRHKRGTRLRAAGMAGLLWMVLVLASCGKPVPSNPPSPDITPSPVPIMPTPEGRALEPDFDIAAADRIVLERGGRYARLEDATTLADMAGALAGVRLGEKALSTGQDTIVCRFIRGEQQWSVGLEGDCLIVNGACYNTLGAEGFIRAVGQAWEQYGLFDPAGDTIATRILPPPGYQRPQGDGYAQFIRNQPLMPDGSPVLLYDNTPKGNQNAHVAVLQLDVGDIDLQQCADAALRLRCEYLYATGQYEKISYHLTNGDVFPYIKYRQGYRLKVEGNKTSLVKTADFDGSYATFRKYLTMLFAYAGTLSVSLESAPIEPEQMQVGDVFVKGGSPGHLVMVMDLCRDSQGHTKFLLGQSYMPAQQMHILKNPASDSPWYDADSLSYPFHTPQWTFLEPCLMRMP
nr:DUF4846 domain-containing protein [bacterium]